MSPGGADEVGWGEGNERWGSIVGTKAARDRPTMIDQELVLPMSYENVALLIPCLRQTSPVLAPASCSRKIPMICSSVNRLGFMSIPSQVMDSTHFWRRSRGSAQVTLSIAWIRLH